MKGLRTVLFGGAVALLGLLEKFDVTQLADLIPDTYEPLVFSAVGLIVIVLRLITNTPVGKKDSP